jgi:peptidoglycan/LPS O-acetylase OafA/YrhL
MKLKDRSPAEKVESLQSTFSMLHDTTLPRAIATLLIINSHCEALYPYHWLAEGGQVGIFLFFFVSGIGVTASKKTYSTAFSRWFLQRVFRILPAVWLVVPVLLVAKGIDLKSLSFTDWFRHLVYPISSYTFFFQIFPFYGAGYFLARRPKWLPATCILLCGAYLICSWSQMVSLWDGGKLRIGNHSAVSFWALYAAIFALGLLFGKSNRPRILSFAMTISALLVTGICYAGLKTSMVVAGKFAFAFPLLWLLVTMLTVLIFEMGRTPRVATWIHSDSLVPRLIRCTSRLSLEVFLVHVVLVRGFDWSSRYFPLNLLFLVMVSLLISWLLNKLVELLRKGVRPRVYKEPLAS